MSTTHLFVELLIVGLGVVIWIALFVAGITEVQFEKSILDIKLSLWPPLIAFAYVFGILLDRVTYSVFNRDKNQIKNNILSDNGNPQAAIIEKIVMESSEVLNHMIHYNRNRLRICRSWFVNFLLIGVTFFVWQYRVNQVPTSCLLLVSGGLFTFAALSYKR